MKLLNVSLIKKMLGFYVPYFLDSVSSTYFTLKQPILYKITIINLLLFMSYEAYVCLAYVKI